MVNLANNDKFVIEQIDENNNATRIVNKSGGKLKSIVKKVTRSTTPKIDAETRSRLAKQDEIGINLTQDKSPIEDKIKEKEFQQANVGPSMHDGIIVEVDTHEFDISDEELDGPETSDESNNKDLDVCEKVVTPVNMDVTIADSAAKEIYPEASRQIQQIEKHGGTEDDYQKLLQNKTLKRVFEQFYNDRIQATTSKEGNDKRGNHNPLNKNKTPMKTLVISTQIVKSPSDTTLYVPALKPAKGGNNQGSFDMINKISDFVEAIRMEGDGKKKNEPEWPQPSTSRGEPRGLEAARKCNQQTVLEAEKFKAAIAMPTGIVQNVDCADIIVQQSLADQLFDNNCKMMNVQFEQTKQMLPIAHTLQDQVNFLPPTNLCQQDGALPKVGDGAGLSDDDFFHLTCHIELSLRKKIERGKFMDLEKLLLKGKSKLMDDTRLEWVHRDGGTYLIPVSDRDNKINGIRHWDQAFRVYTMIFCGANPHHSREIWQYISVINTAAANFAWENVANYDYTFRHLMEFNPNRSWAITYNQMWNLSMKDPISKNYSGNNQKYQSQSSGRYGGGHGNSSSGGQHNQVGSTGKRKGMAYCRHFNKGEKCKYGNKCRFVERCSHCDAQDHWVIACPKLKKD